jgi:hypothetical protein
LQRVGHNVRWRNANVLYVSAMGDQFAPRITDGLILLAASMLYVGPPCLLLLLGLRFPLDLVESSILIPLNRGV